MNKRDSVFALVIFLITFQFCFHPCNGFLPTKEFFLKHKWVNITNSLTSGATKGFFSDQELTDYLKNLKTNFPDLVNKLEPIGKTVEGKDIHTLVLTAQTPPTQEKKPRILFTGFLHGTDFMSTATLLHLTNYLIYGYLHKQPDTTYLLENREVWIVPAINLDAYSFVSNYVKSHNRTFLITKNRRQNDPTDICGEAIGVNLNRNFDINFDSLDVIPGIQNSYNPNSDEYRCKPYYRGEKPFSEPETAAIRDLLNKYTFEMGINLIGIGPKFILPQTFAEDTKTRAFYESIQTESPFPQGTPIGTRNVLSQEVFNGELTDYMFAKKNIISGSFMVGINEKGYEGNFPTIPKIQRLLKENLDSLLYFIYKAGENLKIEELKQSSCFIDQTQCTDEPKYASYYFQLKISNSGLKDFSKTPTILLSFSNEEVYTIEQIFLTTSSNERKQVYFTTSNDDHGRIIYHIEGNSLKKGEYFIITPVIIRTSSASLGKYSEIPSDELQYLFASIQHYPTNQISHLKSQIKHPNFDIEEMESKRLAARKLMMTCVICLVSSLFIGLGGFVIVKCLKRQPRSQFKKLEDHSQDFEGQIEMTSSNRKNKHKEDFEEGEKQERQKRKSKDKTKKKRTGSNSQGKEKSPDEPKSKSREGSKEKRGSAKKKEISVAGSKKKYSQLNRHEDDIELQHRKAE